MFSVLFLAVCFPLSLAGDCTAPDLPNGEVSSSGNANHNVATFSCQPPFTLVGRKILKCMAGKWSGEFPICISIGICDPLDSPEIANGRKLKKFRGAVYKVKCDRGFKRYGPMYLTCEGSSWNTNNLPICIGAGCDENEMSNIEYGQAKSMMKGSMYKFKCDEAATMEGSSTVICDGVRWNDTAPRCVWPTSPPSIGVAVDGTWMSGPLSLGQTATISCQSSGGHPALLLTLYKNYQPIGSPQKQYNMYTFTVTEYDNNAVFQCQAQNEQTEQPSLSEIVLEVYWPTSPPSLELIVEGITSSAPVQAGQTAMILCQSKGGHPHPTLTIIRNGEVVSDGREFRNTHTFTVQQEDNNAVFQCRAINAEMAEPVISKIFLEVHYGPTHVNLGGPDEAIAGWSSAYSCVSSRSNPPAEIHWTVTDRNGHEITDSVKVFETTESWDGYGYLTESRLVLSPSSLPMMPSAILRCTATNIQIHKKVASKKWVTVQYAPEKVTVIGPVKVRHGDSLRLECSSSPSVPESSIWWRVEQSGHRLDYPDPRSDIRQMEDGSFVTRSILTVPVTSTQGADVVAECYATNVVLGNDFRAYAHAVEVISPPSMLIISGMDSGVPVPVGSSQSLTCSAQAGNPPAKLHWYRGNQMMQAHYEVEGDTVKAQITFVPHHDDTELRCEAVNEALSEPISSSIKIAVDAEPEMTTVSTVIADPSMDQTSREEEYQTAMWNKEITDYNGDGLKDENQYVEDRDTSSAPEDRQIYENIESPENGDDVDEDEDHNNKIIKLINDKIDENYAFDNGNGDNQHGNGDEVDADRIDDKMNNEDNDDGVDMNYSKDKDKEEQFFQHSEFPVISEMTSSDSLAAKKPSVPISWTHAEIQQNMKKPQQVSQSAASLQELKNAVSYRELKGAASSVELQNAVSSQQSQSAVSSQESQSAASWQKSPNSASSQDLSVVVVISAILAARTLTFY